MRLLFLLTIVISLTVTSQAQQIAIKDLVFMSGNWTLKHEWGDMEEMWSKPMGNNMMSTYRCVKDGKIIFYEFMVIEQSDSVPVMKLRHFNPGSIGWEDKKNPNEYPLITLEKNKAIFERPDKKLRLTYERKAGNQLIVSLEQEGKTGTWEKELFNFQLAKK